MNQTEYEANIKNLEEITQDTKTAIDEWHKRAPNASRHAPYNGDSPCYYCTVINKGCPLCIHNHENILMELVNHATD